MADPTWNLKDWGVSGGHKHRVTINGIAITPKALTVAYQDVDLDAGRNQKGTMVRNKVGMKRSYSITMPACHTTEKMIKLYKAMNEGTGNNAHYKCTFPDPMASDGTYTGEFYVGDRSIPVYNFNLDLWNEASFDLVEI